MSKSRKWTAIMMGRRWLTGLQFRVYELFPQFRRQPLQSRAELDRESGRANQCLEPGIEGMPVLFEPTSDFFKGGRWSGGASLRHYGSQQSLGPSNILISQGHYVPGPAAVTVAHTEDLLGARRRFLVGAQASLPAARCSRPACKPYRSTARPRKRRPWCPRRTGL